MIQTILIPFGILYGCVMQIRNWLYNWGVFKAESFDVPVISVGNITAGGTGKTPFTIFLARRFSGQFKRIAIISRGYGRKSSGLQLVAAKGQIYLDAQQAGDEPFLLAKSLPGSYVIVAEKRTEGVRMAIEKFGADLVILDDAFQHRSVKRNLDILLVNAKEPWRGNFPLPAGTLREFRFNYKRAKAVVFTNVDSQKELPFTPRNRPFFTSKPELREVVDINNQVIGTVDDFKTKKVLAFAGIAHPQSFKWGLSEAGLELSSFAGFGDHYDYTEKDLRKLFENAQKYGCELLLCTEKDMGKIKTLKLSEFPLPLRAVRLNLQLDDEEGLIKRIYDSL